MAQAPFVSVIIPCRNEAAHIRRVLESVLRCEHPRDRMEVLFVDGASTDGTREILEQAARSHAFIRILDNARMIAPVAMNLGIRQARGEVIVRMDAHCDFPPDYVTRCVRLLEQTGAGCVGGVDDNIPNGDSPWAQAVAVVTAKSFGIGNSYKTRETFHFSDTVALGAFPRRVLEQVGGFDERLTRNQDNELNARLAKNGFKVALDPSIRIRYWNQATLRGLARQGYFTGMWNVYTLMLHPYTWQLRRFVPAAFVLYLAALAGLAAAAPRLALPAALPLALYAALVLVFSFSSGGQGGGAARVAATIVSYHLSYGAGTHCGLLNLLTGRWRRHLGRPLKP